MLFDVCMSEPCATIPIASKQRARYGKKYKQIYAGGMGVKFNPVSVWMSHSYGANIEVIFDSFKIKAGSYGATRCSFYLDFR